MNGLGRILLLGAAGVAIGGAVGKKLSARKRQNHLLFKPSRMAHKRGKTQSKWWPHHAAQRSAWQPSQWLH